MNRSFKKLALTAAALVVVGAMSSPAMAAPLNPYVIDPNTLDVLNPANPLAVLFTGANATAVNADRLDGGYTEQLIITGANTFTVVAFMQFGQYDYQGLAVNSSTHTGTGLNQFGGYGLYALFTATGTFSTSGTVTTFNSTSGGTSLYVDPFEDTSFDTSNTGSFGTASGSIDDQLLASAPLISGNGVDDVGGSCSPNCGSFGLIFQPTTLTTLGANYFISPVPFYIQAQLNGVFNPFTVSSPPFSTVQSGAGNLFFDPAAVPEPASLTLLGLGLVGVAYRGRRRQARAGKE